MRMTTTRALAKRMAALKGKQPQALPSFRDPVTNELVGLDDLLSIASADERSWLGDDYRDADDDPRARERVLGRYMDALLERRRAGVAAPDYRHPLIIMHDGREVTYREKRQLTVGHVSINTIDARLAGYWAVNEAFEEPESKGCERRSRPPHLQIRSGVQEIPEGSRLGGAS